MEEAFGTGTGSDMDQLEQLSNACFEDMTLPDTPFFPSSDDVDFLDPCVSSSSEEQTCDSMPQLQELDGGNCLDDLDLNIDLQVIRRPPSRQSQQRVGSSSGNGSESDGSADSSIQSAPALEELPSAGVLNNQLSEPFEVLPGIPRDPFVVPDSPPSSPAQPRVFFRLSASPYPSVSVTTTAPSMGPPLKRLRPSCLSSSSAQSSACPTPNPNLFTLLSPLPPPSPSPSTDGVLPPCLIQPTTSASPFLPQMVSPLTLVTSSVAPVTMVSPLTLVTSSAAPVTTTVVAVTPVVSLPIPQPTPPVTYPPSQPPSRFRIKLEGADVDIDGVPDTYRVIARPDGSLVIERTLLPPTSSVPCATPVTSFPPIAPSTSAPSPRPSQPPTPATVRPKPPPTPQHRVRDPLLSVTAPVDITVKEELPDSPPTPSTPIITNNVRNGRNSSRTLAPRMGRSHDDAESEFKKHQRMLRNRESALESRRRKNEKLAFLDRQCELLRQENRQLRVALANAEQRNRELESQLAERDSVVPDLRRAPTSPPRRKTFKIVGSAAKLLLVGGFFFLFNFNPFVSRDVRVTKAPLASSSPEEVLSPKLGRVLLWEEDYDDPSAVEELMSDLPRNGSRKVDCPPPLNASEGLRLDSELREWWTTKQKPKKKQELRKRKKGPPLPLISPSHGGLSLIPRQGPPDLSGPPSEEILIPVRREDTYYLMSYSSDHLLVPAVKAVNQTSRPRMAVLLPLSQLNGTTSESQVLQIDCEVTNTRMLRFNGAELSPADNAAQKKRHHTRRKTRNSGSVLAISMNLVALITEHWIEGKAIRDSSTAPAQITFNHGLRSGEFDDVTPVESNTFPLYIVCAKGSCMWSCLEDEGSRDYELNSFLNNLSEPALKCDDNQNSNVLLTRSGDAEFQSAGVYIATQVSLYGALLFSCLSLIFQVYNILQNPVSPILSVIGLYIWNCIAVFLYVLTLLLFGIYSAAQISSHFAIRETLTGEYDVGSHSTGYSYWILLIPLLCHVANLFGVFLIRRPEREKEIAIQQEDSKKTHGLMLY
ncbi:unnamed protein product [Cyprideis torosa]|uniref:Uncharacterized protein n=1 Tax=Cyprideis torosa TaxID=163714 RepID=A0A7R8ZM00_9CRUS|nr:unnamed protein product [Cyprideis torosa]CAG0887819.1 unnamed protein product [Cyprideis torosa]